MALPKRISQGEYVVEIKWDGENTQIIIVGSWSIQVERGSRIVVLRSLLWPGLTFYHVPNTKQHGYIYFGNGEKNIDLPFML
ncbi:hypothetical protein E2320_018826 [Naja naja]|nr:hypothetical protein E2320_018826 [Naja naja]